MKQYNIYKTTNLVNGKFYWGVHSSLDENDGYLGSGITLRKAIKKYGKENFRRVTKLLYDTAEEAYEGEAFIVDKEMVENPASYNMHLGGKGGSLPGNGNGRFGKKNSKEHIMKSVLSNNGGKGYWFGKCLPEEMKKKIGESQKGRIGGMKGKRHSEETKKRMSAVKMGKRHSEETKKKMSESNKRRLAACRENTL